MTDYLYICWQIAYAFIERGCGEGRPYKTYHQYNGANTNLLKVSAFFSLPMTIYKSVGGQHCL